MIDLYTWTTPNGQKVSIMLEEVGLPYRLHPINIQDFSTKWRVVEWLMWQMGGPGPSLGQVHHFVKFNPGKSTYAEERYAKEAKRLWGVLDRRLGETEYVAGDYSIADIAIWPWISRFAWQSITFADYPNVKRWYLAIAARPAVRRGWNVPSRQGGIPMP